MEENEQYLGGREGEKEIEREKKIVSVCACEREKACTCVWKEESGRERERVPTLWSRRYFIHNLAVSSVSTTIASIHIPRAVVTAKLYFVCRGLHKLNNLPSTPGYNLFIASKEHYYDNNF